MVMKKVFRPFWSFDIKKTESWLDRMAQDGYQLVAIQTVTSSFLFEKEETSSAVHYHIAYERSEKNPLSLPLQKDGWELAIQQKNWYILRTQKPTRDRKSFPVREGLIRRNRNLLYLFGGMTAYAALTTVFFLLLSGITLYFDGMLTIEANPFWLVTLIIAILLWTIAPYCTLHLYKGNKPFW
ncbi:hypothetical protein OPHB3_0331 [Oceanobacillus picturae]|uniref:DUF2812 domain-containing protein n=2 Tax=Oceanobacillus picturae TaxID=171693 RepID=W9ADL0_9BACI|nr:hypothetical protein OPHB3_0331 [Oceanobacillus picturae]CDO03819.1 hypothetical protein BN988_02346 [Oceanobacillus picturae]